MLRPMVEAHKAKRLRKGKGFSLGELREGGLDPGVARRLGVAVDRRRRSVRKENVEALKSFLEALSPGREKPSRKGGGDGDEE